MKAKIVLIGAGSRSFGLGQIADILRCKELRGRGVTLALVDENAQALELMTRVAERAKGFFQTDIELESHTDRTRALPGAKYVIISVARKRYELWEQDFRIPLAYGFRHVLGENGGPGAIFHALRSFELVLPICRDVERFCPDAFVMNFTNPEARVLHAICHLTKVRAAGFCHGVFSAMQRISTYLQKPLEDLRVVSAGMNHFYCVLSVRDKAGTEYQPELVRRAAQDTSDTHNTLFRKFAEIYDVFTFPSEDHIGEYVSFGAEFHGIAWPYGRERRKVTLQEKVSEDFVREYADGKAPVDHPWIVNGSGELTVPVICDHELNRGSFRDAVNVLNSDGYIENLPRDIVVEVPATVDARGLHPMKVGAIPEAFAAFMRTQYTIHGLLTEAYRTQSRKLLLQALLLDPCVNSIVAAEKMLDEVLALQSEFLPTFQ
jgi:alpha-galactosidase